MSRTVVEPGGTPHEEHSWIDDLFRRNRFGKHPYGKHSNHMIDSFEEKNIEKDIEKILLGKFNNIEGLTQEQKSGITNILDSQIGVFKKAILKQAEEDIEDEMESEIREYTDAVEESRDTRNITEKFYAKLRDRALDIAMNEYDISENFDIEEAMHKERKILEAVKEGRMTPMEANRKFEEPTLFKSSNPKINEVIRNTYRGFRATNRREETIDREEKQR